ncbi:MAG: hypothetical protein JOZ77_12665 [Candidatus Eremiobacteraeota bacterium]|nr:hypothetical protein [Candidatus Eremiobacteraeota bacterium]
MKVVPLVKLLSSLALGVLFTDCGGSQAPIGAPRAMPQSRAIASHGARGGSWMRPDVSGRNLLYTSSDDIVDVYTYPGGKLVGSLGTFNGAEGLCVDKAGDVFVTSFYDHAVYEYAHGGTKQLAALKSPYSVNACSVDPATQNVAASSYYGAIIFPYNRKRQEYRLAKYYHNANVYFGWYCTYDKAGNLFEDGTTDQNSGFVLTELRNGSPAFDTITVNEDINGPGAMQWKNGDLTVADRGSSSGQPAVIYSFSISGSEGTEVGAARLADSMAYAMFWIQGGKVIGPEAGSTGGIGVWRYPSGGNPSKSIVGAAPYGVVVSLK